MLSKLGKGNKDLIPTEFIVSNLMDGVMKTKGVVPIELTVGGETLTAAFFMVESKSHYNA